jgi:hypothetical protein
MFYTNSIWLGVEFLVVVVMAAQQMAVMLTMVQYSAESALAAMRMMAMRMRL